MGGRRDIFLLNGAVQSDLVNHVAARRGTHHFFAGEDLRGETICEISIRRKASKETYVDRDKMNLGVSVLASLRGGHLDDLAGTAYKRPQSALMFPPTPSNLAHP